MNYVTNTVVPLIESTLRASGDEKSEQLLSQLEALKPLLSAEMVNVLQILGFDFRRALGAPLTKLVEHSILDRRRSEDVQLEEIKRQQAYIQLALDADAYARFREMFPND